MPLPGAQAGGGGQVPNPNLAAVAGGEEQLAVGAEGEGGDGVGAAVDGGPEGGVGGIDDLDGVTTVASDEGAVGRDGERAAGVELLQRLGAPVVLLERQGRRRRRRHAQLPRERERERAPREATRV